MIRRRASWLYQFLSRHLLLTNLIVVVLVVSPGYYFIQKQYGCATGYVEKTNAATTPVRAASTRLDQADDRVWAAVKVVLTQHAGKDDYAELRAAVAARATLSDRLADERAAHPFPDPPSTFC